MTRKLFSILFIMLLIFMGSTFHLFAQKYHFINKNVADGLPQSQATIFSQDENGQLLIGTFGGLGIYDGYNIKKIDKSNGLLSNLITHIDRDSKGILYIIHVNGLTKIAQHQTFHYKFPKQDLFFNSMIIDQKDQIWILLNNQLFLFKNGDFINFMDILTEQNTLLSKSDNILSIGLNAKNELLIATAHQGILKWDGKSLTTFFKNNTQLIINQLFIDNNGLIYIIDLKNIYSIDRLYNLKKHTIPSLKSEEYITKFYIDSKKNYWLATNLGGIYYKADQDEWEYINFEKGFTSEQILDIYEDNEQTIWLSTDGSGIFSFKHQGVTYYDDYSGFNTLIISIIEDIHNNVLLVGNQGLYILYNQNNIRELLYKGKQIRGLDIIKVDNGSIYIATLLHGILKWDGQKLISILPYSIGYINSIYQHQSKLIFSSAHQLYEWHAENIQKLNFPFNSIATLALNNEHLLLSTLNGVFIYNLEKDNYQEYELIDNKNILSLTQNEQYIFLGSLEDGLYIVDKKSQKVRLITSEEGLSCNSVYSLMLDQYNQLWIGTGCGLDMIKFQEDPPFIIKKMADYLGLGHIETNSRGLYEDHEGKIWIGTNNKLFIYDPKKDQISHKIGRPPLLFESVQLFSKSIWASELNMEAITNTDLPLHPIFRPTENHLTFSYKAVSLSQANNINYRYQLIGVDKDFTETKQTTVIYPNLSPGEYNFRVWASDLEGHFDDHHFIDFPFTINTPYWQTMYFWIGLLLLSTAVTFGIMYYRNKWKQDRLIWAQQLREEAQDKVRQSTAEDFHDEIGNKLTRIKLLSSIAKIKVSKENQEAQKILEQIIDNVQQLFTGSKDIIWSLQPDSNYLNEVIWKIQQNAEQLVDNSNISLSMDDEKLNNPWKIQLPMQWGRNILMIFKEALTNAVRHSRAQEISFKVWEEDDSITLILKDNGQGISTNITEGNGLRNMQLRAQRIDASLNIKSNSKGTEIQLILWKEKLKRK